MKGIRGGDAPDSPIAPVYGAFAALDARGQAALRGALLDLLRRFDRGGCAGLVVPGEYLEVVLTR